MINIIIFSKNRPAQLELLLRSMKKYFKEFSDFQIKILHKFTNENFFNGYERLKSLHSDKNIIWKSEDNFQNDLISLVDLKLKYTVFFVDDIIFKEPFSITDDRFKFFESHGDILCLSLRLHPRLTYCYAAKVSMNIPPTLSDNGVFQWKGQSGDYGYPMSLDGHIFKTRDIIYYISFLKYDGPNPLESIMASQPLPQPKMICYDKSIIVNNPANKVQKWNQNYHGEISPEYLNEQFLLKRVIDLTPYEGLENISCHQELPINFI